MFPVHLIYHNNSVAGPGALIRNLENGLDKLGIAHNRNKYTEGFSLTGMLQQISNWKEYVETTGIVVGPNLYVLPTDNPELSKSFKHFLVPSQWCLDLYRQFSILDHASIDIWAVGIDTDLWKPTQVLHNGSQLKGLLYYKNRAPQDLELIKRLIVKSGASIYKILEYGKYQEQELMDACVNVDFCVLLTNTESQGIAYQQILSSGVPCYVFDKTTWNYDGQYKTVPATSVPYFNKTCGMLAPKSLTVVHFQEFLHKLSTFKPREYIINNLSLTKQAQMYYDILINYQGS